MFVGLLRAGLAKGLPTTTPNSATSPASKFRGQPLPALHDTAVNTSPVRGSATIGPCHSNELIDVASLKLLAPRLLLGTVAPGSAGWYGTPSSVQPKARPAGPLGA